MSDERGGSDGDAGERALREIVAEVVARFIAEGLDRDPVKIADAVMIRAELKPAGRLRYIAAHRGVRDEARNQLREINGAPALKAPDEEEGDEKPEGDNDNVVQLKPEAKKPKIKRPVQLTFWPDPRAKYLQKSYPTKDHIWVPVNEWEEDDWRIHVLTLISEYEGRGRHINALIGLGEWRGWKLYPDAAAGEEI